MIHLRDFICRGRRPRRPASLIFLVFTGGTATSPSLDLCRRRFFTRDVEDAVPYTIIAPYTALIRYLFVVLTLN